MMRIGQEIKNSILTAFYFVMMIVYPFYIDTESGYEVIGDTKYYFFRNVSILVVVIMLLIVMIDFLCRREKIRIVEHYKKLSGTDWFVYGYLIAVLLSYALTAYKKEALWGAEGWYMGLMSQLVFLSIYFLFSRYFEWKDNLLYPVLTGSALVFLLGILNRYSIYPIALNGQTPVFISTLGNINWFCGYWAVLCPLGVAFFWISKKNKEQIVAGFYVVIAFLSGVTQGSSSAYLAFAGIFLFLFCLSFYDNTRMKRFLELCFLFLVVCQLARILRYLPGVTMNYESSIGKVLTDTNLTLFAVVVIGILSVWFGYLEKKKAFRIAEHKIWRNMVLAIVAVGFSGYVVLLIVNTCLAGGIFGLAGSSLFTFNNTWANSRGGTWTSGILAYRNMSFLQRLIGIGPDCFAEYLYAVPELAERVYSQFGSARLTNAHNEWLTILVNTGALGLLCYAGIFVSAIWRFVKKAEEQPMLFLCVLCILAYTVHNMVSFQQILNTPYVFLLLGIGEGMARRCNKS